MKTRNHLTRAMAIRMLIGAGFDADWAERQVTHAELAGTAAGRAYSIASFSNGLFTVSVAE